MNITGTDLELLSRADAAKRMKISPGTLRLLINRGEIGVLQIGKREKIPVLELYKYIQMNTMRCNRQKHDYFFTETTPNDILVEQNKLHGSLDGHEIINKLLNNIGEN